MCAKRISFHHLELGQHHEFALEQRVSTDAYE